MPPNLALNTIRVYAITKLDWIKIQQRKMRAQERETPREYLDRESHVVWSQRRLLRIVETATAPRVALKPSQLELHVRPCSDTLKRHEVLEVWYREQIKAVAPALLKNGNH